MAFEEWFRKVRRLFPWRIDPTPYKVWISEIMLQQTRASAVIPYFLKWMELFPSVEALAAASLESVIKCWEGLGYYSRARSLHSAARQIMSERAGVLPADIPSLLQIKGIGPYTAGAIMSFAFRQKAAAVDGNVLRVMSRYLGYNGNISKPSTLAFIARQVEAVLPDDNPWLTMEGLIELGATLCSRVPQCAACPLQGACRAYRDGTAHLLPCKTAKPKPELLYRTVALICSADHFLVKSPSACGVMGELWQFPFFERPSAVPWESSIISSHIAEKLGIMAIPHSRLPPATHTFTRFKAHLDPWLFQIAGFPPIDGYEWLQSSQIDAIALSSGHRRIWNAFVHIP